MSTGLVTGFNCWPKSVYLFIGVMMDWIRQGIGIAHSAGRSAPRAKCTGRTATRAKGSRFLGNYRGEYLADFAFNPQGDGGMVIVIGRAAINDDVWHASLSGAQRE